MTARRLATTGATLALAVLAAGFVRTTSETTGAAVFWPLPIVPYHVNPVVDPPRPNTAPSCDPTGAATPAIAAIRESFAAWSQPCGGLQLVFGGTIPEIRTGSSGVGENVVVIRRGWCSQNPDAISDPSHCLANAEVDCGSLYNCFEDTGRYASHGIVALTSVLYEPSSGRIFSADIELNGWTGRNGGSPLSSQLAPEGWYFTCDPEGVPTTTICASYGDPACHYMDLRNTVTHEAGHFIGLAHPCGEPGLLGCGTELPASQVPYADRTMSPTTLPGETRKQSLSTDDVAGVCAIYPQPSGCGCGAGEGIGAASLALAALALRRRRARSQTTIRPA